MEMKSNWTSEYVTRRDLEQVEGREGSQDKGIVALPPKLLEKIDRNRDKLSRAEFLEFCIDTLDTVLECSEEQDDAAQRRDGPRTARYEEAEETVSHSEFENLKKDIKELMQVFIDLLLSSMFESMSKATREEQERFKRRITGLLR